MPTIPAIDDIHAARARLRPHLAPTGLEVVPGMENVWLKLENTHPTHSFKVRGALNALLTLPREIVMRGIVAASSGNHAQGVAWAAKILGVQATIVMPEYAARRKVANARRLGAEAILYGATYDDAEAEAHRIEHEEGRYYLSPYNDPAVVAGAGTAGLEIIDSLSKVERVVVPVGGGGLISGIALAIKSARPEIEIIGVNAEEAPDMFNLFYDRDLPLGYETLADALPGGIETGSITISLTRQYVDRIILVSEAEIARAIRWMIYEAGWVGEGGGVVGMAALLSDTIQPDISTVVVISGGNIDGETLRQILTT